MTVVESLSRNETNFKATYRYVYRLIKSSIDLPSDSEYIKVQSYGIEVERQDIVNDEIINIEREEIKSISPHRYKVHNLFKLLYENSVSPVHLLDVVGEYVDEYIFDYDKILNNTNVK